MDDSNGVFISRTFESLLKESTGRKYARLQQSLKEYLDRPKDNVFESITIDGESPRFDTPSFPIPSESIPTTSVEISSDSNSSIFTQSEILAASQSDSQTANSEGSEKEKIEKEVKEKEDMESRRREAVAKEMNLIISAIRSAIETKQSRFIEKSLDCIHKLIEFGYLEGEIGIENGKNSIIANEVFQMVCNCADNTAVDSVILKVIRVILISIASPTFQVHGESLILAIRTCYNISLTSKNSMNVLTAKGTLTQIISMVFKRMEISLNIHETNPNVISTQEISQFSNEYKKSMSREPSLKQTINNYSIEEIQNLATQSNIKALDAVLDQAIHSDGKENTKQGLDLDSLSLVQRDPLLIFRTICKLAMKEGNDDLIIKTKILSLELLQGLLENLSYKITLDFAFIDSIKMYLCYSLVRAYVSHVDKIFQLSCSIFSVLIKRFRESLKAEIGLFFPLVILRTLDSSDTVLSHRMTVTKMLEEITSDPQILADVFVNYDCDLEFANLFEKMVFSVSKISQGMITGDSHTATSVQTSALRTSSVKCLVNILQSMVDWSKEKTPKSSTSDSSELPKSADSPNFEDISDNQDFEKQKAHKSSLESAVAEFNLKPEKGISYLKSHSLIDDNDANSIANFLLITPGLNKTLIGDYLGQHSDFHISIMHHYVNLMNFKGMKFDLAIRKFLKGFKLPGEAQKIDRIMEKFAEKYCGDNPGIFKSADVAYVLAYAVIMLNTDAHNQNVSHKMTKSDFLRINSVTEGEESAPEELLEEIYDSIVKNEIKLNERGKDGLSNKVVDILKLGMYTHTSSADVELESREIVMRTQSLVKSTCERRGKKNLFHRAVHIDVVRPMLESVGWSLLASFSAIMEDSDSKPRVSLCVDGFKLSIFLTKFLDMETMRYAFLTSLIRFTFLHAPKEMRSRNVEALKTLLDIAENEPDLLQNVWNALLECISRLDHIIHNPSLSSSLLPMANQVSREALLSQLVEISKTSVEQVFVNSVRLDSESIVDFFNAVCGVSLEELKIYPARIYSLQKIVEISYYNITRIRMVWAKIWAVLSPHFVYSGNHPNEKIAMYAINSLKQLAIKYLEHEELMHFTFQNDILKPFVILMRSNKVVSIRELIVNCITEMIKIKVSNIKSGWKSVFMILTFSANDVYEKIVENAFENLEQVVLENFDQIVGDCFMDCVNCLIAYANNKISPRISLKAIALLRICEDRLADGNIPGGASRPIGITNDDSPNDADVSEFYWFPMLAGLSDLTSDPRVEVRNCAVEVLFDLLKERGMKFSHSFWKNVFNRVLFPIFDYVRHAGTDGALPSSVDVFLKETSIHCLHLLCDVFCLFYKQVSFMLPSLLSLLLECSSRNDQNLSYISLNAFLHLIDKGGNEFSENDWSVLLDSIRAAHIQTQPTELLGSEFKELPQTRKTHFKKQKEMKEIKENDDDDDDDDGDDDDKKELQNQTAFVSPVIHLPSLDETKRLFNNSALKKKGYVENGEKEGGRRGEEEEEGKGEERKGEGLEHEIDQDEDGNTYLSNTISHKKEIYDDNERNYAYTVQDKSLSRLSVAAIEEAEKDEGNKQEYSLSLFGGNLFGKKLMASMMDTLLLKNLTFKFKGEVEDAKILSPPSMLENLDESAFFDEDENIFTFSENTRTKCYVQLLLIKTLNHIQGKYWSILQANHKRKFLEIVYSLLTFSNHYNHPKQLAHRIQSSFSLLERSPPCLLRQEIASTKLYLSSLLLSMASSPSSISPSPPMPPKVASDASTDGKKGHDSDGDLKEEAKQRFLEFCHAELAEAVAMQVTAGSSMQAHTHKVIALRAPVTAQVLISLSELQGMLFQQLSTQLYHLYIKLICSDQMEVRKALGQLLTTQIFPLIP